LIITNNFRVLERIYRRFANL